MNLLHLAAPIVGESPTVGFCVCGRKIWDPVSLLYEMGSGCRKKHGITGRQRVRLARTWPGGDCNGQGDLLEAAMPDYITTDASDFYHAGEDCPAFQRGHRGVHEIRRVTAEQAGRMNPCRTCLGPASEGTTP